MVESCSAALRTLPPDVLARLGLELDLPSLALLMATCKTVRDALACEELWNARLGCFAKEAGGTSGIRAVRAITTLEDAQWTPIAQTSRKPTCFAHTIAFSCHGGRTVILFGGADTASPQTMFADCWALDTDREDWFRVTAEGPSPRMFGADGGGGGVLKDGAGDEWLAVFGGLCSERYRDNDAWLLGPLGAAEGAGEWQWRAVQADGVIQSRRRPLARFHHTLTVTHDRQSLFLFGGHDRTMHCILEPAVLSVGSATTLRSEPAGEASVAWQPVAAAIAHDDALMLPVSARARHCACACEDGVVVVGGEDSVGFLLMTAYVVQPHRGEWRSLPRMPGGRARATCAVVQRSTLIVCGGVFAHDSGLGPSWPTADVWTCDIRAPAGWQIVRAGASPLPRTLDAPAAVTLEGGLLVVGGGHAGQSFGNFEDATGSFFTADHAVAMRVTRDGRVARSRNIAGAACGGEGERRDLPTLVVPVGGHSAVALTPQATAAADAGLPAVQVLRLSLLPARTSEPQLQSGEGLGGG